MSSTRVLKGRIRSVKNTKQITKAMELVAASKMRRAQDSANASGAYFDSAREVLTYLALQGATKNHKLFAKRDVKTRLLIVVAADRGLAGAYSHNINKLYTQELRADDKLGIKNETIAIGRKATQFVTRLKDTAIVGAYEDLPDRPSGRQLHAILDTAKNKFLDGQVDAVDIVYTEFVSTVEQNAKIIRLLPAGFKEVEVSKEVSEATFEPDVETVIDAAAYRLIGAQLFQALLDARASEYVMRMLAMKNATDNASDLVDDLTLEMNKARQAAVTQELSEISGGVEAMKD